MRWGESVALCGLNQSNSHPPPIFGHLCNTLLTVLSSSSSSSFCCSASKHRAAEGDRNKEAQRSASHLPEKDKRSPDDPLPPCKTGQTRALGRCFSQLLCSSLALLLHFKTWSSRAWKRNEGRDYVWESWVACLQQYCHRTWQGSRKKR